MNLPIVIAAYNRPQSLKRLLNSLDHAEYPEGINIELIISIDYSGNNDSCNIAFEFEWAHGEKTVIAHKDHKGLKAHILSCGDLVFNYDGIILLEDDLLLSPSFYYYSLAVSNFYAPFENISGFSLYSYERNEFCDLPFSPIKDGLDTFFMKIPSSWGQIFLQNHWNSFRKSYNNGIELLSSEFIPESVIEWPETSWKKLYFKHMLDNDLYFVFPQTSYSSNMGETGTHFYSTTANFIKTNLTLKKDNFCFPLFTETVNIYDQFMEWEPQKIKVLKEIKEKWDDIEIDLYGYKPLTKILKSRIITSRQVSKSLGIIPIDAHPIQLNLIIQGRLELDGSFVFNTSELKDVIDGTANIGEYFNSCICPSFRTESFNEGMLLVMKKSIKYRIGHFILFPFQYLIRLLTKSRFSSDIS